MFLHVKGKQGTFDDMEVEVAEHTELEGGVGIPVRIGLGDRNGVEVVQD